MTGRPPEAVRRYAEVRVTVHVEDWDAPGYFVDIDGGSEFSVRADHYSVYDFQLLVQQKAREMAAGLVHRLYDHTDPTYGDRRNR